MAVNEKMVVCFQKEWQFLPVDDTLPVKVSNDQNKLGSVETKFEGKKKIKIQLLIIKN